MDRDEATTALSAYLHGLDDAALKRVRDAALARWTADAYVTLAGCRCLLGHAEDWYILSAVRCGPSFPSVCGHCPGEDAFHWLVDEDGLSRTVASIRLLATTLLREREIASLEAFCPLAAREESLT